MKFIFKVLCRFNHRFMEKYARISGVNFGKDVRFLSVNFGSEPYLITIGDHVTISGNVSFVTHDGGTWILRNDIKDVNLYGQITIGNNVFIGTGSILLPGITLGDNLVVGAGSVVTKSFDGNCIIAGNPARIITSYDSYKEKILKYGIVIQNNPKAKKEYIEKNKHLLAKK